MGRSIPSFRMLIDIERLNWGKFKETLSDKGDKKSFNRLFTIPKLYSHSLSNLSRPLIMEPIIMSVLFHNFKEVSKIVDEVKTSSYGKKSNLDIDNHRNGENLSNFTATEKNDKTWFKDYNYARILEEWKEFTDCLSKEDESIFVEMISNCYSNFHLSINSINNNSSSEQINRNNKQGVCSSSSPVSLFMALLLYQQKQLKFIRTNQRCLDSYN
jgi:hypothetical protein